MNKYREEYEKRTGQKAKTPNNSAFKSSYVTEIESKLEQAEKENNGYRVKVLMCGQVIVDEYRLHDGIYSATKPKIYHEDETIESLIKSHEFVRKTMKDMDGDLFINDGYVDNLKLCELKLFELKQIEL